jgi:plasmid stabilization system protein ParE
VSYRVVISPRAATDMALEHLRMMRQSPTRADTWLRSAQAACQTLSELPRRCSLAPENDSFDDETRQLLYGDYRILFTIENDAVVVLHVRHGSRRWMEPDELIWRPGGLHSGDVSV